MDRLLRTLRLLGNAGAVANAASELSRASAQAEAAELVIRRVGRDTPVALPAAA